MADYSRRTRARLNVDGAIATGGDRRNRNTPRRAGSSAPGVERVTTVGGVATLDPNVAVSFVLAERKSLFAFLSIQLPDGTVDGFQKTVAFMSGDEIDTDFYRLYATFDEVPVGGSLNFPSVGGGAVLVWNAEDGFWLPVGVYLSST